MVINITLDSFKIVSQPQTDHSKLTHDFQSFPKKLSQDIKDIRKSNAFNESSFMYELMSPYVAIRIFILTSIK